MSALCHTCGKEIYEDDIEKCIRCARVDKAVDNFRIAIADALANEVAAACQEIVGRALSKEAVESFLGKFKIALRKYPEMAEADDPCCRRQHAQ